MSQAALLREIDADAFAAFADCGMSEAATHTTRDGTATAVTIAYDDVALESYSEAGTTVTGRRRELWLLLDEVAAPVSGDTITLADGTRWRLQTQLELDASLSHWIVTPIRGDGA